MSTHRVAGLFGLVAVISLVAVAVAGGAPRPFAGDDGSQAQENRALLAQPTLRRDMRAFARRERARRLRALIRAGVVPIRGAVDYGTAANGFGAQRGGHVHNGQDMFAPTGTPLVAVRDGVVVEIGSDGGRGNYLVLYSPAARQSYSYFHMVSASPRRTGERVRAGQRVGAVGCSGSCQGAHLHFEAHRGRGAGGTGVDPMPLLRRWRALSR